MISAVQKTLVHRTGALKMIVVSIMVGRGDRGQQARGKKGEGERQETYSSGLALFSFSA